MGWGQQAESNLGPTQSCREIGNTNRALLPWLLSQKHKHNKACCPLDGVRPSPQQVRPTNLHPMPFKKLFLPFFPIPLPVLYLTSLNHHITSCQPCPVYCQTLWASQSLSLPSLTLVFPQCTHVKLPR